MPPGMKFRAGADLFEEACQWTLAGIAHQFPDLDEEGRLKELRRRLAISDGTLEVLTEAKVAAAPAWDD